MSNYYMKEKKDEEKMREHIDKNVLAIKNATKSYNKLIHTCENYCRKESLFLSTIEDLSETLSSFSKSQITDLDQGLGFVTSIIEVMYIGRSVTNSLFSDAIIPKLKQSLQQYQTAVSCFERKYDTDMRKYTYNLDAAEKKAASSKSKSPEYIQQTIEEFKLADGAKQKYTVYALQASTKMVRGLYCGIIKQFCDLFENEKNSFEQIANTFKSNGDEILNMANSVENYGEEVDKLIRPKQQTLIDLKALTPQLKKVLKDAGLRRKDLCDPETVKLLITTVENAVKAGKVDHSVLQMLKAKPGEKNALVKTDISQCDLPKKRNTISNAKTSSNSSDVVNVNPPRNSQSSSTRDQKKDQTTNRNNLQSTKQQTKPVSTSQPPQKQSTIKTTPQPSSKQQKKPSPTVQTTTKQSTIKTTPQPSSSKQSTIKTTPQTTSKQTKVSVPTKAPPPTPTSSKTVEKMPPPPPISKTVEKNPPPPPPKPTVNFLDDINKGGHVLKKPKEDNTPKMSAAEQGDLTTLLANAMNERRKDVFGDDDDFYDDDDEEEWSD